jgi:TonB family protein
MGSEAYQNSPKEKTRGRSATSSTGLAGDLPGFNREGAQSVADQTSAPSNVPRLLPLTVRLAPHFVNSFCAQMEKTTREQKVTVAGLLFGVSGESLVVLQSFRPLHVVEEGPLEDQRLAKAFEQAFGESQTDSEVSALDLVGWYSLRASAGLQAGDMEFHNAHFRRPKDIALILRSQADGDISLEFYSRAKAPRLSPEQHRWGALRLSTDVPVLGPIEVTMRAAIAEDELKTLDSLDQALEGERRKSRSLIKTNLKIFKPSQPGIDSGRQAALEPGVPGSEGAAGAAASVPALLLSNRPRLWWVPSAILVAVFAVIAAAAFAFFFLHGLRAEKVTPGSLGADAADSGLGLRAEARGGEVLLSWNRRHPAIHSAKAAILHIDDGAVHRDVQLDAVQIDNAAVLYRPKSDDVTFRLEVRARQSSAVRESLRVLDAAQRTPLDLGTAASEQAPTAEAAPLQPAEHPDSNTPAEAKVLGSPITPAPISSPIAAPMPTLPSPSVALLGALEAGIAKEWERRIEWASASVSKTAPPVHRTASRSYKSPGPVRDAISTQPDLRPKIYDEEPPPVKQLSKKPEPASVIPNMPQPQSPAPIQPPLETQAPRVSPSDFTPARPTRQVVPDTTPLPSAVLASSPQVKVLVEIDKDGHVTSAQVVGDSRNLDEALMNAALLAAKYWTFEPATLGGRSVASEHTILFRFRPPQ